jgi:hypothetical protein
MRYIKTYEEKIDILNNFKEGDFVKLTDSNFSDAEVSANRVDDIFVIIDIRISSIFKQYNTIKSLRDGWVRSWTLDSSIRHLTEDEKIASVEEINDYIISNKMTKYNL